jgi:hypothetical protein
VPVDPADLTALSSLASTDADGSVAATPGGLSPDAETQILARSQDGAPPALAESRTEPVKTADRTPVPHLPRPTLRVAGLAGASVVAGLLCGLVVPTSTAQAGTGSGTPTLRTRAWVVDATGAGLLAGATVRTAAAPVVSTHLVSTHAIAPRSGAPGAGVRASLQGSGTASASGSRPGAWVLTRPLPARSGSGRRVVYAERAAHLWIVAADGTVLRDYKVTGRVGRPAAGTYHVFSKSTRAINPGEKLTFDLMVRFTHGLTGAPIGFHTIPRYYDGRAMQRESDLGRAIGRGGCVRQSRVDATVLYAWVHVHDAVVVLR